MRAYETTERKYRNRRKKERFLKFFRIYALAIQAIIVVYFAISSYLVSFDQFFLRVAFQLRGESPPPKDIVLLTFDKSLTERYQAPIRKIAADAYEKLAMLNPRAVIFDILYVRDDKDPESNMRIAKAISKMKTVVANDEIDKKFSEEKINLGYDEAIMKAAKWPMSMKIYTANGVAQYITAEPQNQSIDRRLPLYRVLKEFVGGEIKIPGKYDLINYYGGPGTIPSLSIEKLLDNPLEESRSLIENKLVFVGVHNADKSSVKVNTDQLKTSYSKDYMYGVEIHATIAGNLLNSEWLKVKTPYSEIIVAIVIFSLAILQYFFHGKKFYYIFFLLLVLSFFSSHVLFLNQIWITFMPSLLLYTVLSFFITPPIVQYINFRLQRYIDKQMGFDTDTAIKI